MLCCIQCHLFNKDSWQCGKACVTIPQWYLCAKARTDSYFYFHPSLLYVMAVTFNVTVHVTVEISGVGLVQSAFYFPRSTALDTVKCEIPPITTVMTSRDSDISRIVYTKGCVTDLFLELTGLYDAFIFWILSLPCALFPRITTAENSHNIQGQKTLQENYSSNHCFTEPPPQNTHWVFKSNCYFY